MSASEDAPIIKLANSILGLAIKQGRSDIHIEPMEGDVTVRFRIDGVLQVVQKLPKRVQLGLISRFKILSKLDIAEKRLPQDGRISVSMDAQADRLPRLDRPGQVGREGVHAHPRPVEHDARPRQAHLPRRRARARARDDPAALRHHLRHRADRVGENDDAVFGAGGNQRSRRQHLDRRRSDRIRPARRDADSGEPGDRADVRERAARVPAPGSGRPAGRRDARQGDRAHRGRSRADRPSRVHDAPHQQRRRRVHAAAAKWTSSRSSCRRPRSASSRSGSRGGCARRAKSRYPADANIARFWGIAGRHARVSRARLRRLRRQRRARPRRRLRSDEAEPRACAP